MKDKKTLLIFALVVLSIAGAFVPKAYAQQYNNESDFKVEKTDSAITITGYLGTKREVNIPPRIQNLPVTGIGGWAFYNCKSLTNITIPDSVISIGDRAFSGCKSLTNISIPDSVTTIGDGAFYQCDMLTTINVASGNSAYTSENGVLYNKDKTLLHTRPIWTEAFSVIIPDSVTSIGNYAFSNCFSLINITIPDSVTNIGDWAFSGCRNLINVIIPDSVISIGNRAFSGCNSLTSVNIPDSVESIGNGAFHYCTGLVAINISVSHTAYTSEDGVLYNKDKTLLHTYPAGKIADSFIIPDSVTIIGDSAFSWCKSLIRVTVPDTVTSIGDFAFVGCDRLTGITIPDNVTTIGTMAFFGCYKLVSVTIPDSVTIVGDSAFSVCSRITNITIGNSVTSIGAMAFWGCRNLINVIIPDSVTFIGYGAFRNCHSLISVTFQGTINSDSFSSDIPFPGNLRDVFYATNKTYGTPGTYTRPNGKSNRWTFKFVIPQSPVPDPRSLIPFFIRY